MRKGVNMINGIGSSGSSRIGQTRTGAAGRGVAASEIIAATTENAAGAGNVSSPAAKLAQLGAPIDAEKIAAINAAAERAEKAATRAEEAAAKIEKLNQPTVIEVDPDATEDAADAGEAAAAEANDPVQPDADVKEKG